MSQETPSARPWAAFEITTLGAEQVAGGKPYHEFLRVPDLSAGVYHLAKGDEDRQSPHARDELYYVVAGRGRFTVAGNDIAVAPGAVLYVAAGVAHRFHSLSEDLTVLVVFAEATVSTEECRPKNRESAWGTPSSPGRGRRVYGARQSA